MFVNTDVVSSSPFLQVEEDGIEAEEQKADGSSEPQESCTAPGIIVDPSCTRQPLLGVVVHVLWVWPCQKDGSDACHNRKGRYHPYRKVESMGLDKKAEHDWVNKASYAGVSTRSGRRRC